MKIKVKYPTKIDGADVVCCLILLVLMYNKQWIPAIASLLWMIWCELLAIKKALVSDKPIETNNG